MEDKYGEPNRSSVAIVPTNKLDREGMYQDTSLQQRRASRDEIDQVGIISSDFAQWIYFRAQHHFIGK